MGEGMICTDGLHECIYLLRDDDIIAMRFSKLVGPTLKGMGRWTSCRVFVGKRPGIIL